MLPHFKRSYLVEDIPAGWEETVRRLGCVSFQFWHERCSQEQVEACARTGVPLYAYTVNDPARAQELMSWGLAGVFSDCPHTIRRHLWSAGLNLARSSKLGPAVNQPPPAALPFNGLIPMVA
jgi:glycerophosphoryl diester phosphodiesterase